MLLDRLEAVLNRNVADSRRALALTRQLDGRVMSLTAEGTPVAIFFHAEGGRLRLTPRHESPADASLSGTPVALLALAGPQGEGALRGGGVRIEGDAEVAQKFRCCPRPGRTSRRNWLASSATSPPGRWPTSPAGSSTGDARRPVH
jgi:ubiquinone biosynthesis protein UbiJ